MSIRQSISKAGLLTGVVAMSLVTLGSAAQAYDRDGHRGYGRGHVERSYGPPARRYDYGHQHRSNSNKVAQGVAIGVGALILGTIIAAEANRRNDRDYND